ncbi:unnamed protein product, partial [Rotaria socialis]
KATNNNDDDEGDGGGEDESYEPNVSFKPIVQLSAVEVKTGEDDSTDDFSSFVVDDCFCNCD